MVPGFDITWDMAWSWKCVEWLWNFCTTLNSNFLCDIWILLKSCDWLNQAKEEYLHVLREKRHKFPGHSHFPWQGRKPVMYIMNGSKALYCWSVYCIFISFMEYTTMSKVSVSFYCALNHRPYIYILSLFLMNRSFLVEYSILTWQTRCE